MSRRIADGAVVVMENTGVRSDGGVRLRVSRQGDLIIIALSGQLDADAIGAVRNCIEGALRGSERVCIVDCREVTIVDSRALRMVLTIRASVAQLGKELRLIGCDEMQTREKC